MLVQFQTKVVYLSDNATQTKTKMTKNLVEIKKILKIRYINFDSWAVTYVTIVKLLPQRDVLIHKESLHNHCLKSKINW